MVDPTTTAPPAEVAELADADLPPGEVLVDVDWSAVNYKDAMVTVPGNRVARRSPLVPGVDLAGTVAAQRRPDRGGGHRRRLVARLRPRAWPTTAASPSRARVPAGWVVPLPDGARRPARP